MAIYVDEDTKVVVSGLTGREGTYHAMRNRAYGTQVVAGVTPGKGGMDVEGVPVFDTIAEAVEETGANTSMVFVPARFAVDACYEAADAGVGLIVCITEGIPARDEAELWSYLQLKDVPMIGPNCPGVLSPGKSNVGIMPTSIATPGRVGLVSRSGTLTYQVVYEMTNLGVGQSTCVGIGGDPFIGQFHIDVLERFNGDPETDAIVMIGEIGGDEEERAAEYIRANVRKPVVGYVAGFEAPPGRKMGHAGAIISGSKGTAQAKAEALEAAGVKVGRNPTEVAQLIAGIAS